jgi:hypothetical protein
LTDCFLSVVPSLKNSWRGWLAAEGLSEAVEAHYGKKVPAKYRSPSGETWAGRGAKPRWLVDAIKGGRRLEDFLIDKSAGKGRKKRRSKR